MIDRQPRKTVSGRNSADRRGSVLVLLAFTLVIILVGVVFAIDVAYVHVARTEVKAACDLSALAAVEALTRTQDTSKAVSAAKDFAKQHKVGGRDFKLDASDVVFGRHRLGAAGKFEFDQGVQPYTAVRITGTLASGAANSPLQSIFAGLFGVSNFEVARVSTGVQMDRDIALVLDISTSMSSGGRFQAMVDAANAFVDEIELTPETERVMIVSYNRAATNHQSLTESTVLMRNAINALQITVSGTAIGEGLLRATNDMQGDPQRRPLAQQVIVLMTDGNHNTGVAPGDVVGTAAARHQTVNTITFGPDANITDMQQVASAGHGIHIHAPGDDDLIDAFRIMAQSLESQLTD